MFSKFAAAISLTPSIVAFAWCDHTFTSFYTLNHIHSPRLEKVVQAETLEKFLLDMKKKHAGELQKSINKAEMWAKNNLSGYHPTPQEIVYREAFSTDKNIVSSFIQGTRINPNSYLLPYIRDIPLSAELNSLKLWDKDNEISFQVVNIPSLRNFTVPGPKYYKIKSDESLPAIAVLLTAADEPDLGLDISLFDNNNTEFGKKYGFGKQPYGDDRVPNSSAVPFHFGIFHESKIMTTLSPQIKESYSLYRIKLYRELAKAAFAAHHEYWGWRFLGRGLHYIQDLTQPYHTNLLPGYSTSTIVFYYGLSVIGIEKPLTHLINLIANRHFMIEDFVLKLLENPQLPASQQLINELGQIQIFEAKASYQDSDPINIISVHSFNQAQQFSDSIKNNFPKKYVDDPSFLYVDKNENILKAFTSLSLERQINIINSLSPILENTGVYTRSYLKEFL